MEKTRPHLLHLVALAALAFPAISSAAPVKGQGTWVDCGTGAGSAYSHGPNFIFIGPLMQDFLSGPLAGGTFTGTEQDNFIGRTGSAEFHGSGTFVGPVSGQQGSYAFNYQGTFPAGPHSVDWSFSASFVIVGKSDAGHIITAQGTFVGNTGSPPPEYQYGGGCTSYADLYGINYGTYEISVNVAP